MAPNLKVFKLFLIIRAETNSELCEGWKKNILINLLFNAKL